ncbi:hypothetical protein BWR18_15325 [Tateyamaria omphalii]|uniref:Cytochrome b561 bacterial/Ni-hydrogenase domain-containing protein n=1 Tax=Tateyamaria omphalii TaxID=299262 RepID=A0A1P8MXY8_9RHOB|nr:hypothetical protein BWR18_15325 [Tateyamaria omphalii]
MIFHWLTAALVGVMLVTGFAYTNDLWGKAAITGHQISGQALILVLAGRIIMRVVGPRVTVGAVHSFWERGLAIIVHLSLYLCLIALTLTGYVAASALGETALALPIDRTAARSDLGEMFLDAHFTLKWVLLALLTVHIAASLKHAFFDRDGTFSRMTFQPRKDQDHA